jgi:hypothetical protein
VNNSEKNYDSLRFTELRLTAKRLSFDGKLAGVTLIRLFIQMVFTSFVGLVICLMEFPEIAGHVATRVATIGVQSGVIRGADPAAVGQAIADQLGGHPSLLQSLESAEIGILVDRVVAHAELNRLPNTESAVLADRPYDLSNLQSFMTGPRESPSIDERQLTRPSGQSELSLSPETHSENLQNQVRLNPFVQ